MLKNRTFEGEAPKSTKRLYCSTGMFRDASYQFVSLFLLTFVQFCGLGGLDYETEYLPMYGAITIIIIILRIWDGINDPIMGYLVEKVHFKSGKYRPWIMIGGIGSSLMVICMYWILPTGWAYVACFGIFYFLWDFTFTMNDIAFWSVLPSLSTKEKTRANITTTLSIFISIGTFAVGAIVPMFASGAQQATYQITAIITSVLYCLSQVILAIFMKEKKVDEKEEQVEEKIKIADIFKVFFKNDQLRLTIISIFLYYTGSSILTAAGLNYFYFNFGYAEGGSYQTIFTVVYAIATLVGQFLYPLLVNKLNIKRKTLLTICTIGTVVGYVGIFSYVFLPDYATFFPLLCVVGFITFLFQTIIGLVQYVMLQDCIDYNEYKYGERRESPISALRAFSAKIASSIQQGILYVFLIASSLLTISNDIATLERKYAGVENSKDLILIEAEGLTSGIEQWQIVVFQIGFALIPLLLVLGCYLVVIFKYKIDENEHQRIILELEHRHEATGVSAASETTETSVNDENKEEVLEEKEEPIKNDDEIKKEPSDGESLQE